MPGDCHYLEGNVNAKRRVSYIRKLLEQIGLEPERVKMVNVSSTMAPQLIEEFRLMREQIAALGPNPLKNHLGDQPTDQEVAL